MKKLKILTFNWHEGYIYLLAKTGYEFDVVKRWKGGRFGWIEEFRPVPPNCNLITEEEAVNKLDKGYYDRVICHNLQDFILVSESPIPKVLLHHNNISIEAGVFEKNKQEELRRKLNDIYRGTKNLTLLFVSEAKKKDWGLDGEIIPPGIDPSEHGGYTGVIQRVLRVGNGLKERDIMLGYSVQERLVDGFPSTVLGLNPAIRDSILPKDWDDLKRHMMCHRLYLNTTLYPYEDGYNLAMLEAMATGMPVVSIENPTSPLEDGVNGFISFDENYLREKIEELFRNKKLAQVMGEKARETVFSRFPIDNFIRNWRRVLGDSKYSITPHHDTCKKGGPIAATIERRDYTVETCSCGLEKPRISYPLQNGMIHSTSEGGNIRLKILMSYTSNPQTTAAYIEKAMRKYHDVITYGPTISDDILKAWDLEKIKDRVKDHDIPYYTADVNKVIEDLLRQWHPDVFLWVESGIWYPLEGIERLPCIKVCYLIDVHLDVKKRIDAAKGFDYVFIAQKEYLNHLREEGIKNVFWLPLACDPEIHGKRTDDKIYDIGFVGSLTNHTRRMELLNKLKERFRVYYERCFLEKMAEVFSHSRIVFNYSINNDLNMRVFEALCSGSMLLTDEAKGSGLSEIFQDKKHLVIYRDENELSELADYYLRHDEERERIAEEGMKEVLSKHTYEHRVKEMMDIISSSQSKELFTESPILDNHPEARVLQPYCIGKGIDVGCGFRKTHPDAIGVDILGKGEIGSAGCIAGRQSVADIKASGDDLYMFKDGELDYVVSRHNLEHYVDPIKTLLEWKRVLKPGGILGIVLPDESKINTLALDPTHKSSFTPSSIRRLLDIIGGFEIIKIEPVIENWSFVVIARKMENILPSGNSSFMNPDNKGDDYYRQERKDVEALIPDGVKRVLDIGCGEGILGKRLLQKGAKEVVGVEINPEAAEKASKNLSRIVCGNVEAVNLPFDEGYFDCIILGDVIEHLKDPLSVINNLIKYLSDSGVVVASIPNVRYYRVMNMLVEGRWRYEDSGILDKTHLRFFTKKEMEELFAKAGLEITGIIANINPQYFTLDPLLKDISFGRVTLRNLTPEELKDLFVVQYLIRARKARCEARRLKDIVNTALESGNLEEAMAYMDDYLRVHPVDTEMLLRYAEVCSRLGELDKALDSIDRTLLFDPENKDAIVMKQKIGESYANQHI